MKVTRTPLISVRAAQRYVGKQDMIMYAFAPWCGHCVAFKDEFETFAATWAQMHPNVVAVRMNADKNLDQLREQNIGAHAYGAPISDAIHGFPTILFLKRDGTAAVYGGHRSLEPLMKSAEDFFKKI